MTGAAALTVLLPLAGGCTALLLGRRGWIAGLAFGGATVVAAGFVAVDVWTGGPRRVAVGGWGAPLGIELTLDGLSAWMLIGASATAACVAIHAVGYFEHGPAVERWSGSSVFWPIFLFLWAGLDSMFLSADLFNLYVGLELITLAAVAMVGLEDDAAALSGALRYLLAAYAGSLSYLTGVAIIYGATGTLDITLLGGRLAPGIEAAAATALIIVGLGLKTALFPLHFWLPRAHAAAPAPVSALLSGLVVTAAFYVLLRVWFGALGPVLVPEAGQLLGGLGSLAIIWGSAQAIRQQRLKLMLAYSTIAQIGYLFLVFPLAGRVRSDDVAAVWAAGAWSGGVYHAVAHAFAKAAMFAAAGCIVRALGDDRIAGIRGIASHLPITTAAFGLAGLTLIGVPPSGGFTAKWLLVTSAIGTGQWWWAIVILFGGMLTAGYVFQVLTQDLSRAESETQPIFAPVPRTMEYATLALALIGVLMGIRAATPLALLAIGAPFSAGQ